jgi:hypothetical protein
MFDVLNPRLFNHKRIYLIATALCFVFGVGLGSLVSAQNNLTRSPSDVVREFYKALREHRFREAWSMTIYKPAVEGLTAEEMEDLRPTFETRAGRIPQQVEITGEQIKGNTATVFVKIPADDSTPQITSEPVNLISSGGVWIIGDEANQAIVRNAGRRYFLDALIDGNQSTVEDFLKQLVGLEAIYAQQHGGGFGDLKALISAGLISDEVTEPKSLGYNFHLTVAQDGKSYVAGAEPVRYGHTGKLTFWMNQTGNVKKIDSGGKPLSAPK